MFFVMIVLVLIYFRKRFMMQQVMEQLQSAEQLRRLNEELEQRVSERTAEWADLYNNAPCGYHSLDSNGAFLNINDTELQWLGYEREEIIGKIRFFDLLTPDSVAIFEENFPLFKERGWVHNLEFEMVRKDGSILPVLLNATTIVDQEGRYLMSRSTMIDYRAQKLADAVMQEWQAKLEASNRELEAFSYSVSHDLRAPLRGIDGFGQVLLEDYANKILDETGMNYLRRIRTATQHMGELIDDMLKLSRVSRCELQFHSVDLSNLVQDILDRLQQSDPQRVLAARVQEGIVVQGDYNLLKLAMTNLLDNAWKFSGLKEQSRIEFGKTDENSKITCFVRDNGVGFNMKYVDKLFSPFQRLHTTVEFPGTGIGLVIVRRIIKRHGGHIRAEGEIGKGATIYFTLPALARSEK
jgi:PAS domain S-box-containing protein